MLPTDTSSYLAWLICANTYLYPANVFAMITTKYYTQNVIRNILASLLVLQDLKYIPPP